MEFLVSDPARQFKKMLWLTAGELALVNAIRIDKGLGPVLVHQQRRTNRRIASDADALD